MGLIWGGIQLKTYFSKPKISIVTRRAKLSKRGKEWFFVYDYQIISSNKEAVIQLVTETFKKGEYNKCLHYLTKFLHIGKKPTNLADSIELATISLGLKPPHGLLVRVITEDGKNLAHLQYNVVRKSDHEENSDLMLVPLGRGHSSAVEFLSEM